MLLQCTAVDKLMFKEWFVYLFAFYSFILRSTKMYDWNLLVNFSHHYTCYICISKVYIINNIFSAHFSFKIFWKLPLMHILSRIS